MPRLSARTECLAWRRNVARYSKTRCRSIPSKGNSISSRSKPASSAAGPTTTCSARACAAARARPNGCSTRARPRPTAARASTTSGPGSSRTSTPASTRCGASTWPARAAGTATACPVEVEVEKELGFSGKHEIEDYGIERFNRQCRASVQRYVEDWQSLTSRIGMWLDTADAYWTLSNDYIESVWWLFHQMWDTGPHLRGLQGRALLRPLRHRAVEPRARPARRVPRRHRAVGVRALPGRRPRLRPPRVDDHTVDAALERRRRGRARRRLRARPRPEGGRDLVLARGARRRRARRRRRGRRRRSRRRPRRPPLRAAVPLPRGRRRHRARPVPRRRRRLRHRRRRLRHRAPRARVRRDRPRGRRARGPARCQPGQRRGPLRPRRSRRTRASSSRTPTPRSSTRSAAAASSSRRRLHALVPALLALRHAAHLLGQAHVVRAHVGAQGRRCSARTRRSTGTPSTSSTAASATGSRTTSTGRSPATATGARRSRCGAARDCGHDTCVGSVAELSELAGRDLTGLDLHRPYVDDVDDRAAPQCERARPSHRAGARRVVRLRLDARRAVPLPVREHRTCSRSASPPTSSARRSTRRAAGSTRCSRSTRSSSTARRTATSCASRTSSTRTARRCRSRAATSSTRGPCCDDRGADALRWYMFSSGSPWTAERVFAEGIDESTRQFLLTLWNTYSFFVTYANLDGWEPGGAAAPAPGDHVLDRWIRSRLHRTVRDGHRRARRLRRAARRAGARRARRRPLELVRAPLTAALLEVVRPRRARDAARVPPRHDAAARAVLPVRHRRAVPNLARTSESVHLADWPASTTSAIDAALEAEMTPRASSSSLGRAARTDAKLNVRQPLPRAVVVVCRRRRPSRADVVRRDRRRAQREAASRSSPTSKVCSTTRSCRTSARSARRSAS